MQRNLLVITLILFGALSAAALWQHGYLGIFALHFQTFGGAQVLADLVIALVLVMIWMWRRCHAGAGLVRAAGVSADSQVGGSSAR